MIIDPISFHQSLKPKLVEEFLDYYFYRRLAFKLIPLLIRLKLTPNQITTLSMMLGLTAAALVYHWHFVVGGLVAMAAIVLDCCDGQVARLTGLTSPVGRVMDGLFDATWVTALWIALYNSGYFQSHQLPILWLMAGAALMVFFHCWRFDGIKINYLKYVRPDYTEKDLDFDSAIRLMRTEFKRGNIVIAFLALAIAFEVYFFVSGTEKKEAYTWTDAQMLEVRATLDPVIKMWPWLGEGHNNTLVIVGLFLAPLSPYPLVAVFIFILGPMTIWQLYAEWRWQKGVRHVKSLVTRTIQPDRGHL